MGSLCSQLLPPRDPGALLHAASERTLGLAAQDCRPGACPAVTRRCREPRAFPGPVGAFPGPLAALWSPVFSTAKSRPAGGEGHLGSMVRSCPWAPMAQWVVNKSPFQPHLLPACLSRRPLTSQPSPAAYRSERCRRLRTPSPGPALPSLLGALLLPLLPLRQGSRGSGTPSRGAQPVC